MNRGFIVVAQNSQTTDYIKCAEVLCASIKKIMPTESVTLLTDKHIINNTFDHIIIFPYGDQCKDDDWKLANDWQIYDASPYEYTIKIEADIYITRDISYWWDVLSKHDLIISTTIRNFKNEISDSRYYRKTIDDNGLPNAYNALTYFKKSDKANKFFNIVCDIFNNWSVYRNILKIHNDEIATTDVVYAIAMQIIGIENCTLPNFNEFSMIHMKKMINDTTIDNWTNELLYEITSDALRINTIPQLYPFHYHVKSFANTLWNEMYG